MYRLTSYFLATTVLLGALAFAEPVALAEAVATATEAPQSAPAIRVAAVTRHELIETLDVTGSIVPRQEAAVGVDVAGLIVRELNADRGDVVKKGDVLARLDRTALETQLVQLDASKVQAEAAIAQAKAQVSGAQSGSGGRARSPSGRPQRRLAGTASAICFGCGRPRWFMWPTKSPRSLSPPKRGFQRRSSRTLVLVMPR